MYVLKTYRDWVCKRRAWSDSFLRDCIPGETLVRDTPDGWNTTYADMMMVVIQWCQRHRFISVRDNQIVTDTSAVQRCPAIETLITSHPQDYVEESYYQTILRDLEEAPILRRHIEDLYVELMVHFGQKHCQHMATILRDSLYTLRPPHRGYEHNVTENMFYQIPYFWVILLIRICLLQYLLLDGPPIDETL